MHTLLEYDGKLPVYVNITKGSVADNKGGKHSFGKGEQSLLQTDSITIFQCSLFGTAKVFFFVIRHKENLKFETLQERELPPKGAQNILKDEDIILSNPISKEKYPKN